MGSSTPEQQIGKKYAFHYSEPEGAIAGTLILAPTALPPVITVISYNADHFVEKQIESTSELQALRAEGQVLWVNVDGLGNGGRVIYELGRIFGLHPLALEDVGHCHQRAKVEEYEDHTFLVARSVEYGEKLETQQVSVFLGANFLITFQERPRPRFLNPIRDRLRRAGSKARTSGPDYLVYALLDNLMDAYFPVLERYAEKLETLELEIMQGRDHDASSRIHDIKTELLLIRRALWPHRDAINTLVRDPNPLITENARLYMRDCYDHTMQLFELVETYRELTADLRDLYLSSASHRMNEIMKVLTIVSTIFIPLSVIVGIYGMNFDPQVSPWNMPELSWYFGYPFALLQMAGIAGGLLYFFHRRGWIGKASK